MKTISYRQFGPPEVLQLTELPPPALPAGGMLVTMRATSVNVIDSRTRLGKMYPLVNKKFPKIPGSDFSGIVAAVSPGLTGFQVGDAVYGATSPTSGGAFAQTIAVKANAVAKKPAAISFEQAAAIPVTGLAALYSLRELGQVKSGERVLIYGSSGAAGLFTIQLAKHFGAQVTAVCGTRGMAISREMGADLVLDYKAGPPPLASDFDLIVDFSSHFPFAKARPHLTPNGRFVEPSPTIPMFIGSMILNLFRRQKQLMLVTEPHAKDLEFLNSLIERGVLKITIAQQYPLNQAAAAFTEQEKGGVIGKIVLTNEWS